MVSLLPSIRFVNGDSLSSIAADGMTHLRLEPYPTKSRCSRDALDTPPLPLSPNKWCVGYEGEVCNSEHGSDLALKEERNLSFILIISDFMLLLKDACGKQTRRLKSWLWWGGEQTGKQTWNCQSEWDQWLNENHSEIPTRNPT